MTEGHDSGFRFSDVGERLRAFRMGRRLTPEQLAAKLGLSRAALYRTEKGQILKVETLIRIADILEVPLPTLLGVGMEYIDNAIAFFERIRSIEETSEQVIGLFAPISYLLTSDQYDDVLTEVMLESLPADADAKSDARGQVDEVMRILRARKAHYRKRRPLLVSLISSNDLERFLLYGLVGRHDLAPETLARRRTAARDEAIYIAGLIRQQPIGVQIGLIRDVTPGTSFQICRQADRSILAISPFRLGEQPNIQLGVAMITSAAEAMTLHEAIARQLWEKSVRGPKAADLVDDIIAKFGIS